MEKEKRYDLEDRLVMFAVSISNLAELLPANASAKYISGQLIRSGFSSALNYGEAKSAESSNDFIHKMKIVLKELRETYNSLKILRNITLGKESDFLDRCLQECNELVSIFVRSIQTAETNRKQK
jgi:four helix bundle protein